MCWGLVKTMLTTWKKIAPLLRAEISGVILLYGLAIRQGRVVILVFLFGVFLSCFNAYSVGDKYTRGKR